MRPARAIGFFMLAWLFISHPAVATADWLVTPFVGLKFAGRTNFVDLEDGAGTTKITFGGSAALLSAGILGIEAEFSYYPQFFDRAHLDLLVGSNVTTLTGSIIIAVPQSLTGDSLRPYVVGGLGLLRARIDPVAPLLPEINSNLLGLSVGGGAIGPLSDRTSLRFELRHVRNLTKEDEPGVQIGTTGLSFWRATAGLTLRY